MYMIRENRIRENVDRENRSESLESPSDPFTPVGVIFLRDLIDPGEVGTADTPLHTMDDSNFVMPELFVTKWTPHVLSPKKVEYREILTGTEKQSRNSGWRFMWGRTQLAG
jgi:hypothetical protein